MPPPNRSADGTLACVAAWRPAAEHAAPDPGGDGSTPTWHLLSALDAELRARLDALGPIDTCDANGVLHPAAVAVLEGLRDEVLGAPVLEGPLVGPAPGDRALLDLVLRVFASFQGPAGPARAAAHFLRYLPPMVEALFAVDLDEAVQPDFVLPRVEDIREVSRVWASLSDRSEALAFPGGRFPGLDAADDLLPAWPDGREPRAIAPVGGAPTYRTDDAFGRQRLVGPNPIAIRRVTPAGAAVGLPVDGLRARSVFDDAHLVEALAGHGIAGIATLDAAAQTGRLFACDYTMLESAAAGAWEQVPKHLTACVGLFWSAPSGDLLPLGVARGRPPQGELVLPGAARWAHARLWLQNADCVHHEMWTHLGRAHLVLERIVTATRAALPPDHALRRFLAPHFEGVRLNLAVGRRVLINPGGMVDQLLSTRLETGVAGAGGSLDLAEASVRDWRFTELDVRVELAGRGVDDPAALPAYAYRDDATALYEALLAYAAEVVTDAGPLSPEERERWRLALEAEFPLHPKPLRGLDLASPAGLASLLAGVAFLSSGFHAAVNYPQWDFTMIPAAVPMGLYASPVALTSALDSLPSVSQHVRQVEAAWLLSRRRFGSLLELPVLPGLAEAHARLQARLEGLDTTIRGRVVAPGGLLYDYLAPSRVPPSANV